MFSFYNMALELHLMKFKHSILGIYNSFGQVIKPHCKEKFLKKLESCSMSPSGSLSAHFCFGLKFLFSFCPWDEMGNVVFLKCAKCQAKLNYSFPSGFEEERV